MNLYDYILDELDSCLVWIPFRMGHRRDISGQGNHGTLLATSWWGRNMPGFEFEPGTAGGITIADAVSIRPSGAHTIIEFLVPFKTSGLVGGRLWSAYTTGVGSAPGWRIGAANQLNYYDIPGNDRSLACPLLGVHMLAISLSASAATPKGYADGALVGDYSGTATLSPNEATHVVGNYPTLVAPLGSGIYDFMFFDAVLSADEIGIIYDLWNVAATPDMVPGRKRLWPVRADLKNASNLMVHLGRKAGLLVEDLSGQGNDGVVTPSVVGAPGVHGNALQFSGESAGGGYVTIAADATINSLTTCSIVAIVLANSVGGSGAGALFAKGWATWDCYLAAGPVMYYRVLYADGLATWHWSIPPFGRKFSIEIRHTKSSGASPPVVLINGTPVAVTTDQARAGALSSDSGNALTVGNRPAADLTWDGTIEDFRLYNNLLTSEEIRDLYLESARKLLLFEPRTVHPESVGVVGAGGECGHWHVVDGTWVWVDDGEQRALVCMTAGTCVMASQQAYGSWYYRLAKNNDAGAVVVMPIATKAASYASAGQDGYVVFYDTTERLLLGVMTNGGVVGWPVITLNDIIEVGVEYEYFLSRNLAGLFELWARGGAYTSWTLLMAGTDTTHASGLFFTVLAYPTDELSDVRVYHAAMTPHEMESLGHDWLISTGTWGGAMSGAIDGVVEPMYVNATTGILYQPSDQAYGTWEWRSKKTDASEYQMMLIADLAASYGVAGQNGYMFYINAAAELILFYRITNGVETGGLLASEAGYVVAATEYLFRLTRSAAGLFTLWIKGGVHADWTEVFSVTDNTFTTSQYMTADLDAEDQVGRVDTTDEVQPAG